MAKLIRSLAKWPNVPLMVSRGLVVKLVDLGVLLGLLVVYLVGMEVLVG